VRALSRDHTRAFAIFAQIVDAVAHLHNHGFVHNDIKADNILMSEDGVPKLCDFGLACKIGTPSKGAGTTKYMAPELVTDNSN
ncbi:protein kinase domain-containing protein, partial [Streptococcus pneumoniae]|uniref:protein kinase domain-containing protein n=1 Tax=Streptococcus pneumoniae TaxID=1313 RepID=UPI0012D7B3FD